MTPEQSTSNESVRNESSKKVSNAVMQAAEKFSMPQVMVCHAAAMDVSNGAEAQFYNHHIPSTRNNQSGKQTQIGTQVESHILSPLGRRICLIDERFSRGKELTELIHSFEIPHEYDSGTTLRLWHQSIKDWFLQHEWTEKDIEHFNGILAWLHRDSVQVLEIGQAQFRVFSNRLRVKNLISFDGAREFIQDRIKSRLHKKVTGKELFTREQWSWQSREHQVSCRFEETALQGVTRCVGLASDLWLPNELETIFRTGSEARGSRKNVCEETRQAFGAIGQKPRGSVVVVDILPQELDTPDLDEVVKAVKHARRASKVGKGIKGAKLASNAGKSTSGFMGKVVAGLLIVGAMVAGASVIRTLYQKYHEPKEQSGLEEYERNQARAAEEALPPANTNENNAAALDTASVNPFGTTDPNADTLGLKPSMTPPKGKEVWFNEDFYRRNREKLLRGDFKEVPFVVKEFPARFISFAAQQQTFIPIAMIRSTLFNAENIRVEVLPYSVQALQKSPQTPQLLDSKPTMPSQSSPQLASTKNTVPEKTIASAKLSSAKNALPATKKSPFDGLWRIDKQPQATNATQNASKSILKDTTAAAKSKLAQKEANPKQASVPKSVIPKPPQIQQVSRYGILFDKPIPKGRYVVRLYHTEKGKPDTSICEWRVIESPFTEPSLKSMRSAKFYFGKPFALRAKLVPELLDFYITGTNNFRVRYQFGVESPHSLMFTPNVWSGPIVPAFAKKMNMEIVWMDTLTNFTVPLFTREITPEQTPPDILCADVLASSDDADALRKVPSSKKPVPPPNFTINVKGISVDFEVPIDADNKDIGKSKTVRATLAEIESDTPASIDYTSSDTRLTIFNGEEPDPKASWELSSNNFKIIKGDFDPKTGTFPITIQVSNLPPKPPAETRTLRGTIMVNASAKVVNKLAGISAKSQSPSCLVPISVTYK